MKVISLIVVVGALGLAIGGPFMMANAAPHMDDCLSLTLNGTPCAAVTGGILEHLSSVQFFARTVVANSVMSLLLAVSVLVVLMHTVKPHIENVPALAVTRERVIRSFHRLEDVFRWQSLTQHSPTFS